MALRFAQTLTLLLAIVAVAASNTAGDKRSLVSSDTHVDLCGKWVPLNLTELSKPLMKQCNSVPTEIGKLTQLKKLLAGDMGLRGSIPTQIGLLTNAVQIKMGRNQLTGEIPTELFNLNKLTYIWLGVNDLIGTVPTEFGDMSTLSHLQLPSNYFTGPIPTELGKLTKLTGLWFGRSDMNSTIPTELGMLTRLRLLWLWHNNFKGKVPSELGRLTNLTKLSLSHNEFDGHVPSELENLNKLSVLNLGVVHCDCKLLDWYPSYIAESVIFTRDEATFCSSDSEYDSLYPHVLRVEEQAPCSYVYFAQGNSPVDYNITDSSLEVSWAYPYPDEVSLDPLVIDNAYTNASFRERLTPEKAIEYIRDCRTFNTRNESGTPESYDSSKPILGFEIKWLDVNTGKTYVVCTLPSQSFRFRGAQSLTFGHKIEGLQPASEYDLSIRSFMLRFWAPLDISYVFAPQSRMVRLRTADRKPEGSAENVRLSGLRPDEVDVVWDPPPRSVSNGFIIGYRARITSVSAGGRSYEQFTFEPQIKFSFSSFNDLTANTTHKIEVQASTTAGFGPFSEPLVFTTCQENTKWVRRESQGFEGCFAKIGHITLPDMAAVSCEAIAAQVGGVNTSFCIDIEGLGIRDLQLLPGYWRANLNSSRILRCPRSTYCLMERQHDALVLDTPHRYCSENHRGVFCMECDEGFFLGLDGCEKCNTENGAAATALLFITPPVAVFVLYVYTLGHARLLRVLLCCRRRKTTRKRVRGASGSLYIIQNELKGIRSLKDLVLACSTKLRIYLGFLQVLVSFQRTFQRNSPISFGLFSILSVFSSMSPATLLTALQLECYYDFNHYSRMLFATLYPIVVTAFVYFVCRLTARTLAVDEKGKLSTSFTSTTLLELFLVYPSVSQTLFETFMCETFEDADTASNLSKSVLRSDYSTLCDVSLDESRVAYLIVSAFMILVYPIGVVLLYASLLFGTRHYVGKESPSPEELASLSRIQFLIYPYKKERYWFEVYELGRKLLLTSVVGFVYSMEPPSSWFSASAVVTLNLCLACIVILLFASPYKRLGDLVFAVITLCLLVAAVQFSIVDPNGMHQVASVGVEVVIYLGFIFLILSICTEALLHRRAARRAVRPPPSPSPRAASPSPSKDEAPKSPDNGGDSLILRSASAVSPS